MSVNIDPVRSIQDPSKPQAASQTARAASKDTVATASANKANTVLTASASTAPQLATSDSLLSNSEYSRLLTDVMRAFKNYFKASDKANLETLSKLNQVAVEQAQEFFGLITKKEDAITKLNEEIAPKLATLQGKLDDMQTLANDQQKLMQDINAGNIEEQRQYQILANAYYDYRSLGAPDIYKAKVMNFNTYMEKRAAQIEQYNAATSTYNSKVAEANDSLNQFISDNDLSAYIKQKDLLVPQLSTASLRTNYGVLPVNTNAPPAYAAGFAAGTFNETKEITMPDFKSFKADNLQKGMYDNLYESRVGTIDKRINILVSFMPAALRKAMEDVDECLMINNPMLNSKILAPSLLPSSSSVGTLAMQAMDMDDSKCQTLLSRAILKDIINNSNLESLKGLSKVEKEKKIEGFVDQLLILSVGVLNNKSIQSLFPSLGMIANNLPSLPTDSPALAILFSASLANRIQENINLGLSTQTVADFLNKIPELADLPEADKAQIAAALDLGQLLATSKLIVDNLGLQGVLPQILLAFMPPEEVNQIFSQASTETQQENLKLFNDLKTKFLDQNYSEEQAQRLAEIGIELKQAGYLTPTPTGNISETTLNKPLLESSIAAALILYQPERFTPEMADKTAQEVIKSTFENSPYPSVSSLRSAIQTNLEDLGIKNSSKIANAIILTLPQDPNLNRQSTPPPDSVEEKEPPKSSASADTTPPPQATPPVNASIPASPSAPPAKLSQTELTSIIEKRVVDLLAPQLGPQQAQVISQEISKSLVGQLTVIKNQVLKLNKEENQKWSDATIETFKESIKTLISFYHLSLDLMNPAYEFVFGDSIIYGKGQVKNPISIPA